MKNMSNLRYGLIGILFWVIAVYAFSIIAPWTTAVTVDTLDSKYTNQISDNYKGAVIVDHGKVKKWNRGTIKHNRVEFFMWIVVMVISVIIAMLMVYKHKQRKQKNK